MIKYMLLEFYIWFVVVMIILILCPRDRIKLMADFLSQVLPKIPITGIITLLRNREKKQEV